MKERKLVVMMLACCLWLSAVGQTLSDRQDAQWIAMQADGRKVFAPGVDGPRAHRDSALLASWPDYTMPVFRKTFLVDRQRRVVRTEMNVCGLGHFEVTLNGKKVGDHFLDPGWTLYDKEALYVTFDSLDVKPAHNELRVMLGGGFFHIPHQRYYKLLETYGAPKLWLKLVIHYEDGTTQQICTDPSWQVAAGPITFSSIYGGEDYDARIEPTAWQQVLTTASPTQRLRRQDEGVAVKLSAPIEPKSVFRNEQDLWVYDLGQNFAGIVTLTLRNTKAGQQVTLRPGELLGKGRTVSQRGTGSPYYFRYTCRGDSVETWQPRFSYYGFRYVQVEGAEPEQITRLAGLPCSSANTVVGHFESSNDLFNRTFQLIDWAIRSNVQSITTDCPTREKLGWQEQNHLMQHSLMYRYQMLPLMQKIVRDMEQSQWTAEAKYPQTDKLILREGCIPTVCPEFVRFDMNSGFEDTPEWGSSFILCPWYTYLWYGDTTIVSDHYEAMKRYISYLSSRSTGHLLDYGLGDWFDIGPQPPGKAQLTSVGCSSSAIFYYDVCTMARCAALLGKTADEHRFLSLADSIRQAYNAHYFHADSCYYDRDSQTANAMSLYMGLVPEEYRTAVLQRLVDDIRQRDNALTAGDVGYRYVLRALEEGGRSDVIFDMNARSDVPGYGWQLEHGATALTESWQAYANTSNNHLMLGHLMEWFFSGLGGIRQAEGSVAWQRIVIAPQMIGDVTWANTSVETPKGLVACRWTRQIETGHWSIGITIPQGSSATVVLPSGEQRQVAGGNHHFESK